MQTAQTLGDELRRQRDAITGQDHLVSLLENAIVTLEQREERAVERARIAGVFGAYVGRARALERADAYSEVRLLFMGVLDGKREESH
jgi:hypothetical protein